MKARTGMIIMMAMLSGIAHAAPAREVSSGIFLFDGVFQPGTQPDGNSVVFRTSKGAVVVDTGRHPTHTRALLHFCQADDGRAIAVINTHWHLDHVSGNALFREEAPGVHIYATGAISHALKGFLADYRHALADVIAKSDDAQKRKQYEDELERVDSGPKLVPDVLVTEEKVVEFGDRRLELHVTDHAVTESDIWIYDPESKVLVAGDLVTLPVPLLDTACPKGWRGDLGQLAATDFKLLIPGHGAPMDREAFETYRTAFGRLLDCAGENASAGACEEGWLSDVAPLIKDYDADFSKSLIGYYVGLLRSGLAGPNPLCGDPAAH